MTHRKRFAKKGLSWLLSAVLTIGLLSVTGLTAGAETTLAGQAVSMEETIPEEEKSSREKAASEEEKPSPEETIRYHF